MHPHRTRRARAGFTLIELMVVIVILGMLVALVGPRLIGQTDKAKVAAAKTQIENFSMALKLYKLDFGTYPKSGEGLKALIENGRENFLDQDSVPEDPWGNPYIYVAPGSNGHDFEIVSYGEDGSPGGTGYSQDIESWNLAGN
ncbi:MAG: type II secretion system protein GspG [Phycisphaerae bacterium]|nr:MAG: type II secretion system protein GspG [Phycisphaerae bacterium]